MARELKALLKEEGAADDLIADPSLADVPDAPTLAKRLVDTKKMVGRSIQAPGENATAEERAAFRQAVQARDPDLVPLPKEPDKVVETLRGRGLVPKEAKDYTLEGVVAPDGVALTESQLAALRTEAHELGLTKAAFRQRAQRVVDELGGMAKKAAEQRGALKRAWGADYDANKATARGYLEKAGYPEHVRKAFEVDDIDPATANVWIAESKRVGSEPRVVADQDGSTGPSVIARAEASKKYHENVEKLTNGPRLTADVAAGLIEENKKLIAIMHPEEAKEAARGGD